MVSKTDSVDDIVEAATLDYSLGDSEKAQDSLLHALKQHPESFSLHHTLAEVYFSRRKLDDALYHADKARGLDPEDVHIHTTLSRIWMERGNKEKAEHYGAQARMLGWKAQLKSNPGEEPESSAL